MTARRDIRQQSGLSRIHSSTPPDAPEAGRNPVSDALIHADEAFPVRSQRTGERYSLNGNAEIASKEMQAFRNRNALACQKMRQRLEVARNELMKILEEGKKLQHENQELRQNAVAHMSSSQMEAAGAESSTTVNYKDFDSGIREWGPKSRKNLRAGELRDTKRGYQLEILRLREENARLRSAQAPNQSSLDRSTWQN